MTGNFVEGVREKGWKVLCFTPCDTLAVFCGAISLYILFIFDPDFMCPTANFVEKMALSDDGKNQRNSSKEVVGKKTKKGRNRQDKTSRPASNTDIVIEKQLNPSRTRAASSSPKLDPSRQSPYAAPRFFSAPAAVHLPPPPSNWILESRSCASEAERAVLSSSLKAMLKVC